MANPNSWAEQSAKIRALLAEHEQERLEQERIDDEKAIEMAEFRAQAGAGLPHIIRRGAAFGPEPRGRIEPNPNGADVTYDEAIGGGRPDYTPSPDMAAIIEMVRKGRASQAARQMRPRDDIDSVIAKLVAEDEKTRGALARPGVGSAVEDLQREDAGVREELGRSVMDDYHPDHSIQRPMSGGIVRDNPFDSPAGLTREELDLLEGWSQLDNQARDLESRIDRGPGRGTDESQAFLGRTVRGAKRGAPPPTERGRG